MAQSTKLLQKYSPNAVFSFVVGASDIVANKVYKTDASNLLVIAGANEDCLLFMPLTAEKAGMPVTAALVGTGTFVCVASGAIAKDAKVATAASGAVATATTGQKVIGRAYAVAADTELVSIVTNAQLAMVP